MVCLTLWCSGAQTSCINASFSCMQISYSHTDYVFIPSVDGEHICVCRCVHVCMCACVRTYVSGSHSPAQCSVVITERVPLLGDMPAHILKFKNHKDTHTHTHKARSSGQAQQNQSVQGKRKPRRRRRRRVMIDKLMKSSIQIPACQTGH